MLWNPGSNLFTLSQAGVIRYTFHVHILASSPLLSDIADHYVLGDSVGSHWVPNYLGTMSLCCPHSLAQHLKATLSNDAFPLAGDRLHITVERDFRTVMF